MYYKCVLSAWNDANFGYENIASGSEFLLAFQNKVHVLPFLFTDCTNF